MVRTACRGPSRARPFHEFSRDSIRAKLQSQVVDGLPNPAAQSELRQHVRQTTLDASRHIRRGDFTAFSAEDLQQLFSVYDALYFRKLCGQLIRQNGSRLSFRVSSRMTTSGGKTTVVSRSPHWQPAQGANDFEIAVSSTLLFQSNFHGEQPVFVVGLPCSDRLDALLRIFEHEIVHLIEFLVWGDSSCSPPPLPKHCSFQSLGTAKVTINSPHRLNQPTVNGVFAWVILLDSTSGLSTRWDSSIKLRSGRRSWYPDRHGTDFDDGKKYSKYYVPIDLTQQTIVGVSVRPFCDTMGGS